jgi:hypothetical protein
LRANNSEN